MCNKNKKILAPILLIALSDLWIKPDLSVFSKADFRINPEILFYPNLKIIRQISRLRTPLRSDKLRKYKNPRSFPLRKFKPKQKSKLRSAPMKLTKTLICTLIRSDEYKKIKIWNPLRSSEI